MGLIIVDLDGFKMVNDMLGHLAGDELLRDVATALREHTDASYTYRYGGDEFAVLLPGADHAATVIAAEAIRAAIQRVRSIEGVQVSASLGVACLPQSARTPEELVYRADAAMYWAKSTGKNRVAEWNDSVARNFSEAGTGHAGARGYVTSVIADLVSVLGSKDPATREHSERCAAYTGELARELGLSEMEADALRLASLLHDVGKISVPDHVLQKPGPLEHHERERMSRHPVDGADMLTHARAASPAIAVIRHHHEHWDGSGYPDGLTGEQIPLAARILLVTDAFDAMTHDRPYRLAMPVEDAVAELQRCAGTQFDPRVVSAFVRVIERIGDPHLRHVAGALAHSHLTT
jgi:diguanylate cyclase (GGDEF)-like protein/putative nucleotidyltransferase with HDIG domain